MDMVLNANAAQRRGERALGATILATGLATFFPSKVEASGHTPTLPEALHGGWQANFGRGVAALISRVHDQLQQVQLDANADVIHGNRPRDTLLEEIRKDGRITAEYRHAITKAALLNKNGRPTEALAALRDAPAHQRLMEYFKAPEDTPVASRAAHALFVAHEALFDFGKLANGDEETTGNVGQHVAYARENPDVLRVRGLVQSVGAELYRVGAYNDVLAVVRPPVPPRPAT